MEGEVRAELPGLVVMGVSRWFPGFLVLSSPAAQLGSTDWIAHFGVDANSIPNLRQPGRKESRAGCKQLWGMLF